jgi:hypothetical protein
MPAISVNNPSFRFDPPWRQEGIEVMMQIFPIGR